ncbi:MAG: VWA domain-containing protein [Lachnospiraceae bacterium]|nr:VWA domain-containing protein [Lachnospiraceae bacterium]
MSVVLQAYIGALPIFIALVVYLVKKKKFLLPGIIFAIQVIVCSYMIGANAPKPISEVKAMELYETYKEIQDEKYVEAMALINKAFLSAGDQVEITLAKARLYAVQGSWEEAIALYEKVMASREHLLAASEKTMVNSILAGNVLTAKQLSYQASNIHYLKEQGVNPVDFGFKDLSDNEIKENADYLNDIQFNVVPEVIDDKIDQMEKDYPILTDIDKIDKLVDNVMSYSYNNFQGVPIVEEPKDEESKEEEKTEEEKLKERYELVYNINGDIDWEKTHKATKKKINEKLESYKEEYPSLFEEDKYLEAYIFSNLHAGKKLDDILLEGGYRVYEIISNMYMSGIITEKDFSNKFSEEYKEVFEEVRKQCKEVAKELAETEDISKVYVDGQSVEEIINALDEQNEFALQQMSQNMNEFLEEDEVEEGDLSQFYLNMSVIAGKIGDDEEAKELFNEAVEKSETSGNKEFSQVLDIIDDAYEEGTGDLDYIEVADKVATLYDNQFHYDIVSNETVEDVKGVAGSAVSETLARVNIGRIDVSKFPEITVSIQHSGDTTLSKDIMTLKDCGIEIEKYTLEKKTYESSKVILLCDVSGSMRGSIDQLKDAVSRYIKSMGADEKVNIVLFSDKIDATSGFSTNKEELLEFAEREISVRGGTHICESIYDCLGQFADNNIANTLIVMTDGDDYGSFTAADIETKIGGTADKNKVTVYTIGLGNDITPAYLKNLARVGGGEFLYCSNISVLENAFQFIHERINSEYTITFSAEDLDLVDRTLEIEIDDGTMKTPAKDVLEYKLKTGATEEDSEVEFSTELPKSITIDGIDVHQLSVSTERQLVNILGSGFKDAKITNVYLEAKGGKSNCKIKEITDEAITFQVSPSVGEGIYSVFVTIDGKKYKVDRLTIGEVNTDEVIFGAYYFTADKITYNDDRTVLSGNVVLNDYLYFNGDVVLEGNLNRDSSVNLQTSDAAYVHHNTSAYSAFDRILLGTKQKTKAFDYLKVNIYDDGKNYNDYENYEVELPWESKIGVIDLGIVSIEENLVYLYPDRVQITSSVGVLKDNTITEEGPSKDLDSGTKVSNKGDLGFELSIVGQGEGEQRRYGDKYLNLSVALPLEVTFTVYGVPVTVKDLKASLENYNITQAINNLVSGQGFTDGIKQYLTNKEGADLKVSGTVALVSTAALPEGAETLIRQWLGDDIDLIAAEDVYGSVGINYPHIAAGAKVTMLGCVELASIDMEMGAIAYPNYVAELLNTKDGEKHYGFTFLGKKGLQFDWDAVGANVTGAVSGTVLVDEFLCASYVSGNVGAKTKINLFGTSLDLEGNAYAEAYAGVWVNDDDEWHLAATIVAGVDGKAEVGIFGINILDKEIHEKYFILDEDEVIND